ncbi:MAG: hypothetical protein RBT80_15485, partial [Candidatus Vecturithrix sp.]|nr:hypothetical protein [Candidatus Vecturithrix sp.]
MQFFNKKLWIAGCLSLFCVSFISSASAHFQVLLPSTYIVTAEVKRTIDLNNLFTQPKEQGPEMSKGAPVQIGD